jgi:hypothetical protein
MYVIATYLKEIEDEITKNAFRRSYLIIFHPSMLPFTTFTFLCYAN